MTNKKIARLFKQAATLLELHDANAFKIRTFTNAFFNIEKQVEPLIDKPEEELAKLDGIGKSLAKAIVEIHDTGSFELLDGLLSKTPTGVLDLVGLKGVGPKKIKLLWKELNITSIDALYAACKESKLEQIKGFGKKTQESILKNLEYLSKQKGKVHLNVALERSYRIMEALQKHFPDHQISLTGALRRMAEVVEQLEFIIDVKDEELVKKALIRVPDLTIDTARCGPFSLRGSFSDIDIKWYIRLSDKPSFHGKLMLSTGSEAHLSILTKNGKSLQKYLLDHEIDDESSVYEAFDMPFIAPEMREGMIEKKYSIENPPPTLVELEDIKGPIHNHSNYSDGHNTLQQLCEYCINHGYTYLGLSDHSKSAFYARGLREDQIHKQHKEIDALNDSLAPFKIFKGIESDILNDGTLDYAPDVLASFDFIVASIHSNLNMDIAKATNRLLTAIQNPYTTFLGHPTGRLLLQREGYPIDHRAIIDACAACGVIIEINANPWRLDLDWRWVNYAMEKGVMLSINPDAHELSGFADMQYGIKVGRKAALTKEMTFNTKSIEEIAQYFEKRKANAHQQASK